MRPGNVGFSGGLCGMLVCAGLAFGMTAQASDIRLSAPLGGWRSSKLADDETRYTAAYPKPPVNRGAQRYRTLIEGHLAAAGKGRKPHTLIVNGSPMPLYTSEDGRFARPWAFGPGSNSVEIRSPDGSARRRVQFFETDRTRPRAKLRVILSWNDPSAEVDLHVINPEGEHAFWAKPLMRSGGLDVDSVDGAGPEIFSTVSPLPGTWLFYVNYWGNFNAGGYNFDPEAHEQQLITCMLTFVSFENTPNEKRETFMLPLRKIGDLVLARTLRM